MSLERRVKIALDESRLLILGSQVVYRQGGGGGGDVFDDLPVRSRALDCAGLTLIIITLGL